jgi:hypothetical protein
VWPSGRARSYVENLLCGGLRQGADCKRILDGPLVEFGRRGVFPLGSEERSEERSNAGVLELSENLMKPGDSHMPRVVVASLRSERA